MMKYCTKCLMPTTKPGLQFDEEGVCSACRSYENRTSVDWNARLQELNQLLDRYRNKDGSNWDCIVPVSGGKDSTYQVVRMLQLGMNPLCFTATTCDLSDIGRRNIQNIKNMGVDYVEFSVNPKVRRKLNRIGLMKFGDISFPEHTSILTAPLRAAVEYKIPLIVWGEHSQNEFGGPDWGDERYLFNLDWAKEHGGFFGTEMTDLIGVEGLEAKHLLPFRGPSKEDVDKIGVTAIMLGAFIPWDGYSNALVSQAYGFNTYHTTVEGSIVNYENLDNHQTGIHDYFKFLKFGFSRASDIASLHIRRGRLTRQDGLELVLLHDGKFPWTYLGKPLEKILEPLEISVEEFIAICDRFTNKELFLTNSQGELVKDKNGNLTKINYDNQWRNS